MRASTPPSCRLCWAGHPASAALGYTRVGGAHAASFKVAIEEHVAVGRVGRMMLRLEITTKHAELLPRHDRQHRIPGP